MLANPAKLPLHVPFASKLADNSSGTLTNNGTLQANAGSTLNIVNGFTNDGTVHANGGSVNANGGFTGTGTARIDTTGVLTIGAPSTVGTIVHNGTAANGLNLGANNITVSADYSNANFGTGDAFNRRANVAGTGQILAAGDVKQAVTGANVTDGTTATPTLTISNVHVGTNTFNYQVANTGTTGPAIRGALQTGVNGGNITDARLSGSGVTAGNYGPIGPGANGGNLAVNFTVGTAGQLAPMSGQVVHIANNFDNLAPQDLTIALGGGAAAYNLAAPTVTPTPVTLANQRIGGSLTQSLTVANTAPASTYTETLSAGFGANTGDAINNGGTVSGIAGGANNSTALNVGVNTSQAGARSGTVTVNLTSNEVNNSGLGNTTLTPQTITVG